MVEIEALAETRPLSEEEMVERSIGVKILEKARATSIDLKQRAKIKWEVEGVKILIFFTDMSITEIGRIILMESWLMVHGQLTRQK